MAENEEKSLTVKESLARTCILPESRPSTVYHYTSITGLRGILSSGQLWATNVKYLNDSSEYAYADRLVGEVFDDLKPSELMRKILTIVTDNPQSRGFDVYTSCFCESGDLLSQWRAYAGHGTGYAIEFDWTILGEIVSKQDYDLAGRVEYVETQQRDLIRSIVEQSLKPLIERDPVNVALRELINAARAQAGTEDIVRLVEVAAPNLQAGIEEIVLGPILRTFSPLLVTRAFLKSPVFSEERE